MRVEGKGRNARREIVERDRAAGGVGGVEDRDMLGAPSFKVVPLGELIDGANDSKSFVVSGAKIVVQNEIR